MLVQRIFVAFLFIISAVFLTVSFDLTMTDTGGLLGAGFFPRVISILLLIMTLIYFLSTFRKSDIQQNASKRIDKQKVKKQVLFGLLLIVTMLLINIIGMIVSLGLFMIFTLKWFDKMSWRRSISLSVILMLVIYVVFVRWLGLVVPTGLFY